jgi:hypothetical protein
MSSIYRQQDRRAFGGGSHSHNKRAQLIRQQQAQQVQQHEMQLSGIPPAGYQDVGDSGSIKDGVMRMEGETSFQFSTTPRTNTGYFTQGGVSYHGVPPPGGTYVSRSGLSGRTGASSISISRSLNASKASSATYKYGKTSIQQEYRDRVVRESVRHPCSGQGSVPCTVAVAFLFVFLLSILCGVIIMILRAQGTLFFSLDKEEIIGPILLAGSFIFLAVAVRFAYTAYVIRNREVKKINFQAANASMVVLKAPKPKRVEQREQFISGSATQHAITRTPLGSRTSLQDYA